VVREAPLGHDRPPRNNAGDATGSHGNVTQQHAGMNREVVDALLRRRRTEFALGHAWPTAVRSEVRPPSRLSFLLVRTRYQLGLGSNS
jgi:hypothetical protein